MTDRDYLWCALNLALDQEEELDRAVRRDSRRYDGGMTLY